MKTIIFLFVLSLFYSCSDPKGVSYQEAKQAKQSIDSAKGISRGGNSASVQNGGPFATIEQINKLSQDKQIYYTDPRTKLCFSVVSSRTQYAHYTHYVMSIACVPCDSLKGIRLFVLKPE